MNRYVRVNIGEQRFERIREQNAFYVDKTDFIREWWESGTTVTLITRPRRFGKMLNMSMLECFFPVSMPAGMIYLKGFPFGRKNNSGLLSENEKVRVCF